MQRKPTGDKGKSQKKSKQQANPSPSTKLQPITHDDQCCGGTCAVVWKPVRVATR